LLKLDSLVDDLLLAYVGITPRLCRVAGVENFILLVQRIELPGGTAGEKQIIQCLSGLTQLFKISFQAFGLIYKISNITNTGGRRQLVFICLYLDW
jgi:hypothetical protein